MSSSDPDRVDDAASAPFVPSGWLIERAISAWQQFRAELLVDEELVEDENVIADALKSPPPPANASVDGERDLKHQVLALVGQLIDACVWADRRGVEARVLAAEFTERARRYEARVERFRELIDQMMAAVEVRKVAGRFARASIVAAPSGSRITDETKIPDEYWKIERTLRRADLLADLKVGVVVEGAELSNGGETLRIARLK